MATLFIGLSGYAYKEWQGEGRLYPPGLKQADFLRHYFSRFNALEAVGTAYSLPSESTVAKWIEAGPEGVKVSPKMHEGVTHRSRLKLSGVERLETFVKNLERLEAEGRAGPTLLQLPPNLKRDDDLLRAFLDAIPHRESLPWAMEFRHDSWHAPEVEEMLRERDIVWVAADTDEAAAQRRDTSRNVYVRLRKLAYMDDQLREWAGYLEERLAAGRDCYVYCRHKDVDAPWVWADRLKELLPNYGAAV